MVTGHVLGSVLRGAGSEGHPREGYAAVCGVTRVRRAVTAPCAAPPARSDLEKLGEQVGLMDAEGSRRASESDMGSTTFPVAKAGFATVIALRGASFGWRKGAHKTLNYFTEASTHKLFGLGNSRSAGWRSGQNWPANRLQ